MLRHKAPYCWGKIKGNLIQFNEVIDQRMRKGFGLPHCPNCGTEISNEDVVECVELQNLVSLLIVDKASKLDPKLFIE